MYTQAADALGMVFCATGAGMGIIPRTHFVGLSHSLIPHSLIIFSVDLAMNRLAIIAISALVVTSQGEDGRLSGGAAFAHSKLLTATQTFSPTHGNLDSRGITKSRAYIVRFPI